MSGTKKRWIFILTFAAWFCAVSVDRISVSAAKGSSLTDTRKISSQEGVMQSPAYAVANTANKKKTGWVKKNGNVFYFLKGKKVSGLKKINGQKYYFEESGKRKGRMVTGWRTIGSRRYFFATGGKVGKKLGHMITGWKKIDGKRYYLIPSGSAAGQAATGWMKIQEKWYYFDQKGALDTRMKVDNNRNGDSTGSAKDKTERRAQIIVAKITTASMTKEQKLWACFQYVMKYPGRRPRTPHYYGNDWPVVYANDMFIDGSGNCFSYAAAFAFLARACGYTNVYACNDSGHGWTEIDGKIYDPEEYRNTSRKYYGTSYSAVPGYRRAFTYGLSYAHVKV